MEWIKADEKRPAKRTKILYCRDDMVHEGIFWRVEEDGSWMIKPNRNSCTYRFERGITYWMEYPKPPKGE